MMYRFTTFDDKTEIVHSEQQNDGTVRVYIERPMHLGFKSVECLLPDYIWKDNDGFSAEELSFFDEFLHSAADEILRLARRKAADNVGMSDN